MAPPINLDGMVFGSLKVIAQAGKDANNRLKWQCRCTCGKETVVSSGHLRSGHTTSCGCGRSTANISRCTKHGEAKRSGKSKEYATWTSMIRRCFNEDDKKYPEYGGRGITVCDRWRQSFENFLSDMGRRPSPDHTIDRIKVNGNYEPENCRWATDVEQARNKRGNIMLTLNGQTLCIAEWAERLGLPEDRIRARVRLGWSDEDALQKGKYRRT